MSLTFKNGDMFAEPVEALVNTVNCVGVMGKGVALEFKQRWPENFKAYKSACDAKVLVPGKILVYENARLFTSKGPRFLVNFPTKAHWRSPSKLAYIEDGLDALVDEIRHLKIQSIALPPLGCGNGGLDWDVVKPVISEKLSVLDGVEVVVFSPKESIDEPEFSENANLTMNRTRATLLKALSELEVHFDGAFDRLSLQKIVYFLQALGVDFRLGFGRSLYGPYSEPLKKAFGAFERHGMIAGFFNGDRRAHVTPAGCAAADEYLLSHGLDIDTMVQRLARLIEGYESPYGMELLSSVHWLADNEKHHPVEKVIEALRSWSEHKSSFDEISIRAAYARLKEDGLIN
ncbi:MAG: type II toxin-antitoxin system antitoxin DNA ADP-ribosyl glycohydrolase DarG [Sphingopyxis sp.]